MPLFLFRCPTTGRMVQGFSPDDVSVDQNTYEPILCAACQRFHPVNPATGKVLGAADQQDTRPQPDGKKVFDSG
jgi:hypothetical protein